MLPVLQALYLCPLDRGPSLQQSAEKGALLAGSFTGTLLQHCSACRAGVFFLFLVVLFLDVSV